MKFHIILEAIETIPLDSMTAREIFLSVKTFRVYSFGSVFKLLIKRSNIFVFT